MNHHAALVGRSEVRVDLKRRITLPTMWHGHFGTDDTVLLIGAEQTVLVLPQDEWQRRLTGVLPADTPPSRLEAALRACVAQAVEERNAAPLHPGIADLLALSDRRGSFDCAFLCPDRHYRLVLPTWVTALADTDGRLVLVGQVNYVRLWNPSEKRHSFMRADPREGLVTANPEGSSGGGETFMAQLLRSLREDR